ncbi:MAG: DUF362 domain-containing protein [Promethearchaeota archaeon]
MEASTVSIYKLKKKSYPRIAPFNPSEFYPEYPFKEISNNKNYIYEGFRYLLNLMGLDKKNWNNKEWNPLGEIIKLGDSVVIKPNLVLDNLQNQDCITTHTSLIRAIIDYVIIALKKTGEIIVGDASLQKCNFETLIQYNGLLKTINFYKSKGINIKLIDFRREEMRINKIKSTSSDKGIEIVKLEGDPKGYKVINLKKGSNLYKLSLNNGYKKFRVTNYDPKIMKMAHNQLDHKYLISNSIIQADVIINVAKFKSHRKAGITGCLKNSIGINGSKDWLPHHRYGALREGGDEYLKKNASKYLYGKLNDIDDIFLIKYTPIYRFLYYPLLFLRIGLRKLINFVSNDKTLEGDWHGNDTIWRTIADLNQILIYSDKTGKIRDKPQKKRLYFCDAVITGQSEGPLSPIPVKSGIITGGYDPLMVDFAIASIMNLDYQKIPQLLKLFKIREHSISKYKTTDLLIISNFLKWNNKRYNQLTEFLSFIPSYGWKNIINNNYK